MSILASADLQVKCMVSAVGAGCRKKSPAAVRRLERYHAEECLSAAGAMGNASEKSSLASFANDTSPGSNSASEASADGKENPAGLGRGFPPVGEWAPRQPRALSRMNAPSELLSRHRSNTNDLRADCLKGEGPLTAKIPGAFGRRGEVRSARRDANHPTLLHREGNR
jgi:hypothetical protein